jgi:transcription elongation factor GreA
MAGKSIVTRTGLKKLEDELLTISRSTRDARSQKRSKKRESREIFRRMRSMTRRKDEQRDIEARIEELEQILKNIDEVIDEDEVASDKISIGCRVRVLDMDYDEEMELSIVGSTEANSLSGKISNESPVGKALIGAKCRR